MLGRKTPRISDTGRQLSLSWLVSALLVILGPLAQPSAAWAEGDNGNGHLPTYSSDPDLLLLIWRRCSPLESPEDLEDCRMLEIRGDGSIVLDPLPSWAEPDPSGPGSGPRVDSSTLEILMRSLSVLLATQSGTPDPANGPALEAYPLRVHPDSPSTVIAELSTFRGWMVARYILLERRLPLFGSGNAYPPICQPEKRAELGLPTLSPPWCEGRVYVVGQGPFDGDPSPAERERIRKRLRERLRNLPRGLQSAGEAPEHEEETPTPPPRNLGPVRL